MTGHHEPTGPEPALSSDSLRRVTQYQTAAVNARLRVFALLEAQGVPTREADDLVAALEAGAVAGAQSKSWSWAAWRRARVARSSGTAGMTA